MKDHTDYRRNRIIVVSLAAALWVQPYAFACRPPTTQTFCPCDICGGLTLGAERGAPGDANVEALDGNLKYSAKALSFPDTAGLGSFYLTYNNQPVDAGAVIQEGFGYNWSPSLPRLEERPSSQVWVLLGGHGSTRFQNAGATWQGLDGIRAAISLVNDSGDTCYRLDGTDGRKTYFYAAGLAKGQVKRTEVPMPTEAGGAFTRWYSHDEWGRLEGMMGEDALLWAFAYLGAGDPNAGKTQSIVVYKDYGGAGQTELARMDFEYYEGAVGEFHGVLGDLKYVKVKERAGDDYPTAVTYFRYYTGAQGEPPAHNVKFIVGPASYERLLLTAGSAEAIEALPDDEGTGNLLSSGDFDYRVDYDSIQRVTELKVGWGATCGCGAGGGPGGTMSYSYEVRSVDPWSQNYGEPVKGMDRTNPDGSHTYIEVDKVGAVARKVEFDNSKKWGMKFQYNGSGELLKINHPSACNASNYSFPSWNGSDVLVNYGIGFVEEKAYDTLGRITSKGVRQGNGGTATTLEEFTYGNSNEPAKGGGRYVYQHKVYYSGTTCVTTTYGYEFYGSNDLDRLKKVTTQYPNIDNKPFLQSGVTSSVEHSIAYDGNDWYLLIESTDEEGMKTRAYRNLTTGLSVKDVTDYGAAPHLNLTTTSEHDDYGSVTKIVSPAGQTRRFVYSYLLAGTADSVEYPRRLVTLTTDHIGDGAGATRVGMTHITVNDLDGRVLESADAFVPATDVEPDVDPSDDFDPTEPHLTLEAAFVAGPEANLYNRRTIEYEGGLKRKEYVWTHASNTSGTKYVTEYDHNANGELIRIQDPAGTITSYERLERGRISAVLVGTDDTDEPDSPANMVTVETRLYDWSDIGNGIGDGLLTKVVANVSDNADRAVRYGYDFRGRRTWQATRASAFDNAAWDVTSFGLDYQGRETTQSSYWATPSGAWNAVTWSAVTSNDIPQRYWKRTTSTWYDERGRVYEEKSQWTSMTTAPENGKEYATDTWHDRRGLVIKRREPGNAWTKYEYDTAGRQIAAYYGFQSNESDNDYTAATSVAGDTIVKEQRQVLDGDGRVILQRTYERKASDSNCPTGALTDSGALSYCAKNYVATWHDLAGRATSVVDYGDNGYNGTVNDMTQRASAPPSRSDNELRTDYGYYFCVAVSGIYSDQPIDSSWVTRTDPAGKSQVVVFDNLGRTIREIHNYADGAPSTTTSDYIDYQNDLTTRITYDREGRVKRRIAYDYANGLSVVKQVTKYTYGVATTDDPGASGLCSKSLVRMVQYGIITAEDEKDEENEESITETFAQEIVLAYNRQGQKISRCARDSASTVVRTLRSFSYDFLGRLSTDSADQTGSGVDTTVLRIDYNYDSASRTAIIGSYPEAGQGGEAINQVTFSYTKEGDLAHDLQDHGGGTTWSKSVDYAYSDTEDAAFPPFPILRLSEIDYPLLGTAQRKVKFTRDGQNPQLQDTQRKDWILGRVSKIADEREPETAGQVLYTYMGVGRVVKARYGLGAYYSDLEFLDGASPEAQGFDRFGRVKHLRAKRGTTTMLDYSYSYDRLHSPTGRASTVTVFRSELFAYDDVGMLVKFDPAGTTADRRWNLTATGNWRQVKDYYTYTNLDVREHNAQNEITRHQVRVGGSFVDVKPDANADSYDIEGNLKEIGADDAQLMAQQFAMTYDAWNRLVKVQKGTDAPLVNCVRDGLGRVIVNLVNNEHLYYDGWRLVSVFDDDLIDDGLVKEYVWGVRYIDELVSTVSYAGATRRYHLQDANWNVVLTLDSGAVDQEAIMYDPYGKPEFWQKYGGGYYSPYGDTTSPLGTNVLFQGRTYSYLSASFSGTTRSLRLYDFRHRAYSSGLGRFLQRDPIGVWGDGNCMGNAYMSLRDAPPAQRDPFGLLTGRGDSLRGTGWSFKIDAKSCKDPCCKLEGNNSILEKLLSTAFERIPNMKATTEVNPKVRECMQRRMKAGDVTIRCDTGRWWCPPQAGGYYTEWYWDSIFICCKNIKSIANTDYGARQKETELARVIMHELSHACGAEDPWKDENGEPTYRGPVEQFNRYEAGRPRRHFAPNTHTIDEALVDEFDPDAWDYKTGLPVEKPAGGKKP